MLCRVTTSRQARRGESNYFLIIRSGPETLQELAPVEKLDTVLGNAVVFIQGYHQSPVCVVTAQFMEQ